MWLSEIYFEIFENGGYHELQRVARLFERVADEILIFLGARSGYIGRELESG